MAKNLSDQEVLRLARLGALARLREIEEEAKAIRRMFPGLRPSPEGEPAPKPAPKAQARKAGARKGRTRNVSPEARQAAAERMRAYWARKKGLPVEPGQPPSDASGTAADAPRRPRARKSGARKRR